MPSRDGVVSQAVMSSNDFVMSDAVRMTLALNANE